MISEIGIEKTCQAFRTHEKLTPCRLAFIVMEIEPSNQAWTHTAQRCGLLACQLARSLLSFLYIRPKKKSWRLYFPYIDI